MLNYLRQEYARRQFNPGLIGLWINPFYFARKGLFSAVKSLAPQISGKILDIGCGQKPYKDLFKYSEYVGLELDTPDNRKNKKADLFYDGRRFPLKDAEFDSVFSSQVFEHVFEPDEYLEEVNRVLKPGGTFLFTIPFVWPEHEQPFDFARYSSFGLKHLLEKHGFIIREHRKSVTDIRFIFQLINARLHDRAATRHPWHNLLLTVLLSAPLNICGQLLAPFSRSSRDLYLDNVVLARKQ